ncbi:acyl-CoA thioesterase [Seonamhaeicola maritimus]|uniref:Acyl-CoA thioesterase n=1 Tax=Seonamhaeicola maritimus TaxID=2591822 RepID=A0A5C7GFL7_9FLAO|nr:acyl-CoA thioesterase [Seonamhaeicola maritimus]TXG35784.1 acyl-CoA thioesterase [Seonamhaeicola maritimus]
MRWIRLLLALIQAKFKTKLIGTETVRKSFRVWISDIDVSVMNHAAIMTVLETGRLDLMVRSNFLKVASKNKWFFPSQAISIQFYRPLKVFQKAQIFTRISYVDAKWIYVEQKIERKGKIIAACIVKNTIKKGRETIPTSEIMKALQIENVPTFKYDLIKTYELENIHMTDKLVDNWDN